MFVDPRHRGNGIGKAIMAAIMARRDLQDLRRWVLVTGDAHGPSASYGFEALDKTGRFMEKRDPEVYQRMANG
jgi:GNAT superfamily N-acetyltransferase